MEGASMVAWVAAVGRTEEMVGTAGVVAAAAVVVRMEVPEEASRAKVRVVAVVVPVEVPELMVDARVVVTAAVAIPAECSYVS